MTSDQFYGDLRPFNRFVSEAFESGFYKPLPKEWLVVVADITGSSRAVAKGKYSEVNYLGAACIVAVNNALQGVEVPTVFGGDGATFAIPPHARDPVVAALVATRRWGQEVFDLSLRVGVVAMTEITRCGGIIEVAKMQFSPGNTMAMFRGTGFDLADDLVKADDGSKGYLVDTHPDAPDGPNLQNLSCRWAPLTSAHGHMLCLIIGARTDSVTGADAVYREVLDRINTVVALDSAESSPVKLSALHAPLRISAMTREVKSRNEPRVLCWLKIAATHVAQFLTFKFGLRPGGFDPDLYKQEITLNSDYRKVNGKLRLIIDCTDVQADAIEEALQQMFNDAVIDYGSHRATHAIMTCVTPNVDNHEHVHYIDGSEGGLWNAATSLKARLANRV